MKFFFLILSFYLCFIKHTKADELDITPSIECKYYSELRGYMLVFSYSSSENVTIPHGASNQITIGDRLLECELPINFIDTSNPEDRNDSLAFGITQKNPNALYHIYVHTPFDIPDLLHPTSYEVDTYFDRASWILGDRNVSQAWLTETDACCVDACTYIAPDYTCKSFDSYVMIKNYTYLPELDSIDLFFSYTQYPHIISYLIFQSQTLINPEVHWTLSDIETVYNATRIYEIFPSSNVTFSDMEDEVFTYQQIINNAIFPPSSYEWILCIMVNCATHCIPILMG